MESITHGFTLSDGSAVRPSEIHWHMVLVRVESRVHTIVTGPLKTSGVASWGADAEILWIKFKLGTYLPRLPFKHFVDHETPLPVAAGSRWLDGSAWQFPNYENADTFVDQLMRREILMRDPVVDAALCDQPLDMASRTLRHRFLRSTGLTQSRIRQYERAHKAAALCSRACHPRYGVRNGLLRSAASDPLPQAFRRHTPAQQLAHA